MSLRNSLVPVFISLRWEILCLISGCCMVVYRALYGERGVWVRPASMWNETVERDGKTYRRFTYIGEDKERDI